MVFYQTPCDQVSQEEDEDEEEEEENPIRPSRHAQKGKNKMASNSHDHTHHADGDKKTNNNNKNNNKNHEEFGPNVFLSTHPVLSHKICILRSSTTDPGTFRNVLRQVTYHLGYEATKTMTTRPVPLSVSIGKEDPSQHQDCIGQKLVERTALIPILRSGLGMTDGFLELIPKSAVYHIGMYRIPGSNPVQYFNRLPRQCTSDIAFVLDPVIASASTIMAVVAILKKVCRLLIIYKLMLIGCIG